MRYRWAIKVGDAWYAGTDANVFISLTGTNAAMREVQISDADAINDWEKGDTYHGVLETDDLGDLTSGTLRHDQSGAGSGWQVDWVKINNEEDGREWTATVGAWDDGGRFPMLKFSMTNRGQYDQIQANKAKEAQAAADRAKADKAARDAKAAEDAASADDVAFEKELADQEKQLQRELRKAKLEAELAKKRAEIDKLKGTTTPPPTPGMPSGGGAFRTYELFGTMNGMNVPLSQVVVCDTQTGRCSVLPGGRVIVGEQPGEGFGLAGVPGRWQQYYGGQSPAQHGLDADKGVLGFDGSRGWVLNAQFLSQVFGGGWRSAVYGY